MRNQLAPGFLVASPSLRCPFFHHTLVLLVAHDEDGSFGLVVNRPIELPFGAVLEGMGLEAEGRIAPDVPVMLGGPVSPDTGYLLLERTPGFHAGAEAKDVGSDIVLSSSAHLLRRLARGEGPRRSMLLLGYSGWGAGQLEREMREGSWIPVDLAADLVFDAPVEERWKLALEKLGIDPAHVVGRDVASA